MNIRKNAPTGSIYRVVLAHALAGSCALAQSVQSSTTPEPAVETELAPVTVSAHEGVAIPYDRTGVSVSVLDVEQLKKEGVYTLTEALTTLPGVYVQPGGGSNQRGNVSTLTVRGMSSDKYVAPMLDGMLLGSGLVGDGLVTGNVVARTPLFGLGKLELLRGAQGAVYGSGAMAGVLYMETPEGKGDPSLSIFNEYGSFDSYTGNATVQGRVKDLAFFVSSTYEHTNNDVKYADGSRPQMKHAARYVNQSQAVRLDDYLNEKNKLTFTFRREDSNLHTPGNGVFDFYTNLLTLKYQGNISERYSTSLLLGYYGSDATYGAHGTSPWGTTYQDLDSLQLEWRNAYRWNDANTSTAGLAWRRSDFTSKGYGGKTGVLDSVLSVMAEHSVEPVKGWNSALALRLDRSNVYNALMTVRASTNYKFNRERSRVFASVGRGYAAPSSLQRSRATYTDAYGSEWRGNPGLDCETNWSVDFGAEQQIAKDHYLSATLFWIRTQDGITSDYSAYPFTFRNDASHWTNQGMELALRGTFEKSWNTGYKVACTITQPKKLNDTQIPATARQTWTADIHTSPLEGLTTGVGLSAAVGRVGFASERIDNYLTLRWYAQYEVNKNVSLHLRVENLTNQRYITEPNSYDPGSAWLNPGTAAYVGCTVTF